MPSAGSIDGGGSSSSSSSSSSSAPFSALSSSSTSPSPSTSSASLSSSSNSPPSSFATPLSNEGPTTPSTSATNNPSSSTSWTDEQTRLTQLKRRWKGKARALDPDLDLDVSEATSAPTASSRPTRKRRTRTSKRRVARWEAHGDEHDREREQRDGLRRRDALEGAGKAEGIVLPLDLVGDGVFDTSYSIPVKFGDSEQQFSLQIDTGSSDLWVASTSCNTASCRQTGGRLYDPDRSSTPTGHTFSVKYLSGSATGDIVWDEVVLGGYSVGTQAMAAAHDVQDEPLTAEFSGILGLALPLNSIIASQIPAGTSNKADGAAWASNLFSITPVSDAPRARFLSLYLERPGSSASWPPSLSTSTSSSNTNSGPITSILGIGKHPSSLIRDASKILYSPTVSDRPGSLFWKAQVRGIAVYVDGERREVDVGRSATGAVWPSAVVDSGVPLILATSAIANAVYGALGIGPADDGMYYVPCKTPLNMSITLDTRPEIPLHPLDLTTEPPSSTSDPTHCIGLLQADDRDLLPGPNGPSIGDMVLGIPFMRNVYTVMAYSVPNPDGSFPDYTSAAAAQTDGGMSRVVVPRLGLMALTDPATAMEEFNTVRVLQQPLGSGPGGAGGSGAGAGGGGPDTGSASNTKTVNIGGKRLSTPLIVLVVLGALVALFGVVWGSRALYMRQRRRRYLSSKKNKHSNSFFPGGGGGAFDDAPEPGTLDAKEVIRLARRESSSAFVPTVLDTGGLSEDELRRLRYAAFLRREGRASRIGEDEGDGGTLDSQRTLHVAGGGKKVDGDADGEGDVEAAEFGYRRSRGSTSRSTRLRRSSVGGSEEDGARAVGGGGGGGDGWDGDDSLTAGRTQPRRRGSGYAAAPVHDGGYSSDEPPSSPEQAHFPTHKARTYSEVSDIVGTGALSVGPGAILYHRQTPSVAVPLLGGHNPQDSFESRGLESRYAVPDTHPSSPPADFVAVSAPLRPTSPPAPDATPHPHTVRLIDSTTPSNPAETSPTHYPLPQRRTAAQDLELDNPLGAFGVPLSPVSPHEDTTAAGHGEHAEGGMAGIGSAASRMGLGRFSRADSLVFNRESLMSVSSAGTARSEPTASPPIIPAAWANPRSPAP